MKFKAKKMNRNSICCLNATGGGIIYTLVLEDHSLAKKRQFDKKGVMSPSLSFTVCEIYFNKLNIDSK